MTSISYSIGVYKERKDVFELINLLKENIDLEQDEICVTIDNSKHDNKDLIQDLEKTDGIKLSYFKFAHNFSDLKNFKISQCTKDYIFDLDADERLTIDLLKDIRKLTLFNIDLFYIPRINTVIGLEEEHKKMFNYHPDGNGYINFPDYQGRFFKNSPNIHWQGKIHESLTGFAKRAILKPDPNKAIIHQKNIEKELYSYYNIFNRKENE